MLKKLRRVLLTVLPTVIYAHLDYDNEQNAEHGEHSDYKQFERFG